MKHPNPYPHITQPPPQVRALMHSGERCEPLSIRGVERDRLLQRRVRAEP